MRSEFNKPEPEPVTGDEPGAGLGAVGADSRFLLCWDLRRRS